MTQAPSAATMRSVIRNVCIHVENEQPLLCDLYDLPTQADAGLVCTNVRMLDGKRPIFIDQGGSTFFFPYHVIRFLEIPEHEMAGRRRPSARPGSASQAPDAEDLVEDEQLEEAGPDESLLPVAVGPPESPNGEELELEIDEGFLQRIRDI